MPSGDFAYSFAIAAMRSSWPRISWTRPCRSKPCMASRTSPRASCSTTLFQLRVFLPDDLFELHRFHARILKLREWTPGLDCLMLPTITYQQHTIIGMKAIHKLVHLLGGRKRGFIEHIQAALSGVRLLSTCKVLLQRGRFPCPHRPAFVPRGKWARSLRPCTLAPPRLHG